MNSANGVEESSIKEEDRLLQSLSFSLNPFNTFVSKPSLPERYSIVNNREYVIKSIVDSIHKGNGQKRIIPITGDTGVGKTYVLWSIKRSLKINSPAFFFTVPRTAKFFYYKLYTSIIEIIGPGRLREITENITEKWGADEKKYGIYRIYDSEKILDNAKNQMRYHWSRHKNCLEDIYKIIIHHVISPEKSYLAERWLLGENMSHEDLSFLEVDINLSDEHVAYQILRIILDYVDEGIILMFDDLDNSYDIFIDPFFEFICGFVNRNPNINIIFTCSNDNIDKMLKFIPLKFHYFVKNPIPINNFSTNDILDYFKEVIEIYCIKNDIDYKKIKENHPFYPLHRWEILEIWELLDGNPRDCIREIARRIDKITFLLIQNN